MFRITFHSEYSDTLELFFGETISDLRSLGCMVTSSSVCKDKVFALSSTSTPVGKIFTTLNSSFFSRLLRSFFYLFHFSKQYPDTVSVVVTPTLIIVAPLVSLFSRFKYIIICQGQLEGEGLLISYVYRFLLLFSVLFAKASFSCNLLEKYRWDLPPFNFLKSKFKILPWYGVALSRAKLLSFRSQPFRRLRPSKQVTLCYLGRISESKGCFDLIRLLMHPSLSHVSLTLAGVVESESMFLKLFPTLPSNITILPPISSSDVPSWLSGFDLYITFSRGESIGSAALEALLCGIPVISSLNSGSCQVLRHSVDSYLLDDLRPSSLLLAIGYCLRHYDSMSFSARQLSFLDLPDLSFLATSIYNEF